jgi:hypothetical protein
MGGRRREKGEGCGGLLIFIPGLRRHLTDGRAGDVPGASQLRGKKGRGVSDLRDVFAPGCDTEGSGSKQSRAAKIMG